MKPGDLVVCIEDGFGWLHADGTKRVEPGVTVPVLRNVYTIREIVDGHMSPGQKAIGLLFEEIVNKPAQTASDGIIEPSFNVLAFKRIVTPDIGCFTEMLNKVDS